VSRPLEVVLDLEAVFECLIEVREAIREAFWWRVEDAGTPLYTDSS